LGANIHPLTEPTVVLPDEPLTLGAGSYVSVVGDAALVGLIAFAGRGFTTLGRSIEPCRKALFPKRLLELASGNPLRVIGPDAGKLLSKRLGGSRPLLIVIVPGEPPCGAPAKLPEPFGPMSIGAEADAVGIGGILTL
jgi:hypothetical protein